MWTLLYFIIYGLPVIWKNPKEARAAWLAAKLTAIRTKKQLQELRKKNNAK